MSIFQKGALSGKRVAGHLQDEVGDLQRDRLVEHDHQLRPGEGVGRVALDDRIAVLLVPAQLTSAGEAALADELERIRVARLLVGIDLGKVDLVTLGAEKIEDAIGADRDVAVVGTRVDELVGTATAGQGIGTGVAFEVIGCGIAREAVVELGAENALDAEQTISLGIATEALAGNEVDPDRLRGLP